MKTYKEQKKINKRKLKILKKIINDNFYKEMVGILRGQSMFGDNEMFLDIEITNFQVTRELQTVDTIGLFSTKENKTIPMVDIRGYLREISLDIKS